LQPAGRARSATDGDRRALADAGRAARSPSPECARDRDRRAARLSNREADIREQAATLRHGEPLRARRNGTPSGDSCAARTFGEWQGLAELSEAVLEPRAQRLCGPRLRSVRAR